MDDDALVSEARRLAAELERSGLKTLGKRWRCPARLRLRIVSHSRQCQEEGEPVADIAGRLGLVESTLGRWLRRERAEERAAGFQPVAIVSAAPVLGGGEPSGGPTGQP